MTPINEMDVREVASQLGVTLINSQIKRVLKLYSTQAVKQPTNSWELIVEDCIYIVLSSNSELKN